MKTKIQEKKDQQADAEVENKLSDMLMELLDADIPQCMFDNEINRQLQDFETRFASQGISMQQYLEYTGQDLDQIREMFRPNAEKDVKCRLALEKIAELEKVIITDDEVNAEYNKFATEMNLEIDKIKSDYVTENIMKDLSIRKAFEVVKNNAEIAEVKEAKKPAKKKTAAKASEEDKPAKKTTAKKTAAKKPDGEETKTEKKTTKKKAE